MRTEQEQRKGNKEEEIEFHVEEKACVLLYERENRFKLQKEYLVSR